MGCKPVGRFTEQHDVFFGIAENLKDLLPDMNAFWPEAEGRFHIDAWREVTTVDGYRISIAAADPTKNSKEKLFFLNLGGYKPGEFEEYHYKVLTVTANLTKAIKKATATAFYKHYNFKGAFSHIDDQYGVDVDDAYAVEAILPKHYTLHYRLELTPVLMQPADILHIGYLEPKKM